MNIFTGLQSPKTIFEAQSKYNGTVRVVEFGNVRRIVVDNITQSSTHTAPQVKRLYWGKILEVLKENFVKLDRVMLLGLGGGTLVHLIAKNFPGADITSVEIDQVMVDIAYNYFELGSLPNQRVLVEDAMRVVVDPLEYGISPSSFDALIVDIYVGQKYPDLGRSGNFIANIKNLVRPGGIVIFNRIYREDHQEEVNIFIDYVSEFFSNVKNRVVAGYTNSDNVLIYAQV